MKQLTILGSTGSIGTSTLGVVRANPHLFAIKALVAGRNVELMVEQCVEFRPTYAAMSDSGAAAALRLRLKELNLATEGLHLWF
jgi:1-deoxy-D-xylulose-5-phosphate reductoisomerase